MCSCRLYNSDCFRTFVAHPYHRQTGPLARHWQLRNSSMTVSAGEQQQQQQPMLEGVPVIDAGGYLSQVSQQAVD